MRPPLHDNKPAAGQSSQATRGEELLPVPGPLAQSKPNTAYGPQKVDMVQQPQPAKPPPSPPINLNRKKVGPSGAPAPAAAAASRHQTYSQSMPGRVSLGPPASSSSSGVRSVSEQQAIRLRARYLHTLRIPPPRVVDLPLSTEGHEGGGGGRGGEGGDDGGDAAANGAGNVDTLADGAAIRRSGSAGTEPVPAAGRQHHNPHSGAGAAAGSISRSNSGGSTGMGSLDAFMQRTQAGGGHSNSSSRGGRHGRHHPGEGGGNSSSVGAGAAAPPAGAASKSQPVQIRGRESESILGFWDRRAARTSRRRHTTDGSPPAWAQRGVVRKDGSSGAAAGGSGSGSGGGGDRAAAGSGATGGGSSGGGSGGSVVSEAVDPDDDVGRSAGRGSSSTYLTAAAVSRSRRTTAEAIGTRMDGLPPPPLKQLLHLPPSQQRHFEHSHGHRHHQHHRHHAHHHQHLSGARRNGDDELGPALGGDRVRSGASVESEGGASVVGTLHLDSDVEEDPLNDEMMYGSDAPSSPGLGPRSSCAGSSMGDRGGGGSGGAGGSGGRGGGRYSHGHHSSNDDAVSRSSVTDDSDTDGGLYGSDSGRSSGGGRGGGGGGGGGGSDLDRLSGRFQAKERRRRHSVDSPFFDVMEEEDDGVDGGAGDGGDGGEGGRRGFIPPHMMAQQQRGCFSMGYQKHFRPKPKEF